MTTNNNVCVIWVFQSLEIYKLFLKEKRRKIEAPDAKMEVHNMQEFINAEGDIKREYGKDCFLVYCDINGDLASGRYAGSREAGMGLVDERIRRRSSRSH